MSVTSFPPARGRLATRMTALIGAPVSTVARVNVVWLNTLRGLGVIVMAGPLIFGGSQSMFVITLACTWAFEVVAWIWLRTLGGPLRPSYFGGGAAAVSGPTFYLARTNWAGRPTKLLGSWPHEEIVLTRVKRIGVRRLLNVRFPGTYASARLEIPGLRHQDDTIARLFGPVRDPAGLSLGLAHLDGAARTGADR